MAPSAILSSVSARAWVSFASISVLWGIPYLFIKVAVDDGISPAFLAWFRVTLAALVLGAIAWRAGSLGSIRGHWRVLLAYAVIEICIPFPLIAAGEQRVDSSLAAILIAAVPLIIAVLALRFDASERVRGSRLFGLLVGFAGVVALVGLDVSGSAAELAGAAMILVAAVGYAGGPMLLRNRLGELDPRALMAGALGIASVVLAPAAALTPPTTAPSDAALASLLVLALFCTAMAFVLFASLINEVGAGRAAVITYVAPIVAVGAGVTVLGERPGTGAIAGLLLIIAGSWLSTDGRLPPGLAAVVTRARRRRGGTLRPGRTVESAA